MRTRKKRAKKEKRRKTSFAKGTQERKQRDNKNTHKKRRTQRWKRREEKYQQKMVHTENNEKKDKYFGWISVGQVARNVEHCLWPPTCSSWQFACCGFQRAQLLSQFIWIRWTHVLLLSCLFWTRFPGCLFFRTCKCLKSVVCRGNKIVFVCLLRWLHDLFVCTSPASCLASTIQLVQFSVRFFVVAALCFSFELNSRPYFAARGFLVGLRGTCNAGVFFRSCWWHLAVSSLSVCTPSSLPLRASCCSGLFCLISLALFVSPAPPSLALAWSRTVFAWATVMDSGLVFVFFRRCCLLDAPSYLPMWSGLLPCGTFFGSWHCSLHWRGRWRFMCWSWMAWHPFMVSFSVLPFSASWCLVGFPICPSVVSGSRRCGCHVCFIEECAALFTAYSAQLWRRESFSLLVDWDDQQLLNAGLHLSRPRTVIFWCGSNRCQQLLLSAWLEVVVIYPVRFWIYSVSSRDFSLCVCLARNSELTSFCVVLRLSCSWTPCMSQWCCSSLRVEVVVSWFRLYLWFLSACVFVTWSWVSDLLVVPK